MSSYLLPSEIAERLNVSMFKLTIWRRKGVGPPWIHCGNIIRYDPNGFENWLREVQGNRDQVTAQELVLLD